MTAPAPSLPLVSATTALASTAATTPTHAMAPAPPPTLANAAPASVPATSLPLANSAMNDAAPLPTYIDHEMEWYRDDTATYYPINGITQPKQRGLLVTLLPLGFN
jgi:hypothetical protein